MRQFAEYSFEQKEKARNLHKKFKCVSYVDRSSSSFFSDTGSLSFGVSRLLRDQTLQKREEKKKRRKLEKRSEERRSEERRRGEKRGEEGRRE